MLITFLLLFILITSSFQDCQQIEWMTYCDEVTEVAYDNVGCKGTYNRVTSFNSDGTCSSAPCSFSPNKLAPFDDELTVHFRGPIHLNQFAVYTPIGSQSWSRIAYYDAQSRSSDGITFMNNLGGQGSGVFDLAFGASVSYAAADGVSASGGPQILNDIILPAGKEISIFSSKRCDGDDCGYYRPGIPAYHGFEGSNKIFLFEFSMPISYGDNDKPSIWLLNAQIPRTVQYGQPDCSCWTTGCGEIDIFETLQPGLKYLISSIHSVDGRGSTNYFARPVDDIMVGGVIFEDNGTITILEIQDFPDEYIINNGMVEEWRD